MTNIVHASDLSAREKRLLFWASFLSLAAAGFGFSFRVIMQSEYREQLDLTQQQVGQIFGAALWPIALTMIGFSLLVDRTGYKAPMIGAFLLQGISGVGTFFADSYGTLYAFALCAGLGHGIVEAVINPICAAVYPKEKTKWLTILHAAWPAGLVAGALLVIGSNSLVTDGLSWNYHALWIILPVIAYGIMYLPCKFPVDERVQAGIPYMHMLRQVGFLGAALASVLVIYEVGNQYFTLSGKSLPENWFTISVVAGLVVGGAFGALVRGVGKPLFFLMCLLMIPVATAELGTDGFIKDLMTPVLEGRSINANFALVFSAAIMLVFRVFAGGILKFFSPPGLLCLSGVFSAVGLYWLSGATGAAVFVAFVLYALGQTYYWPCVLGFVSERYPQGGALTLNTVSAIGLLSAGIVGGPILGVAFDRSIHEETVAQQPALAEYATTDGELFWMTHEKISPEAAGEYFASLPATQQAAQEATYGESQKAAGRGVLKYAVRFPLILLIVFGAIALYFRMRGGYKPIELDTGGA